MTDDDLNEITTSAVIAFWTWQWMAVFQALAHLGIRDNIEREKRFVVCVMTCLAACQCDEIYDTCLRVDNKTANRPLDHVPEDVLNCMSPLNFP